MVRKRKDVIEALQTIIGMIENGEPCREIRDNLLGEVDNLYCQSFSDDDDYDEGDEDDSCSYRKSMRKSAKKVVKKPVKKTITKRRK